MLHLDDLELAKCSLETANDVVDIERNPVVSSILSPIKMIPVIGNLVCSTTDKLINDYQKKKEEELLNIILKDNGSITSSMVNDVEFIINYNKVLEAIRRLATNDKIVFFGNLIKNGYLSDVHIDNNQFDEYLNILNTMSFREIQYLIDYKLFCEEKTKKLEEKLKKTNLKVNYSRWTSFSTDYSKKKNIAKKELYSVFMRIKRTGFIDEEYETDSGDIDEISNSFNSLSVNSVGFCIESSFLEFYDIVLKNNKENDY